MFIEKVKVFAEVSDEDFDDDEIESLKFLVRG
jgi:hypothetical protein